MAQKDIPIEAVCNRHVCLCDAHQHHQALQQHKQGLVGLQLKEGNLVRLCVYHSAYTIIVDKEATMQKCSTEGMQT
jgi:hypothetical protein